ncbi:MAG: hypothetical protein Q9207_006203 [Kuettlingeria erythrocarpa]
MVYTSKKSSRTEEAPSTAPNAETSKEVDPSTYTAAILKYSLSTKESSLYPGAHYRPFAQILSASEKSQSVGWNPQIAGDSEPSHLRPHPFAVIHNLALDHSDPQRVCAFDSVDGLADFANHPTHQSSGAQLVFLRGNPSPKWITLIGVRYLVDPEFFRRHLKFVRGRDFYELPAPPSSTQNIVHLSTTSIGQRTFPALLRGEDDHEVLQEYLYNLGERPAVVGESIVRKYFVHDDATFSIEQLISICVVRRKAGGWAGKCCSRKCWDMQFNNVIKHPRYTTTSEAVWDAGRLCGSSADCCCYLAIIICDHGRDLDEGSKGPWSSNPSQPGFFKNVFIPTIQFAPKIAAKALSTVAIHCLSSPPRQGPKHPFLRVPPSFLPPAMGFSWSRR